MRDPNAKTLVNVALVKEMRARRQGKPLPPPPTDPARSPRPSGSAPPPSVTR
jgi:hypothetical protein